MRQATAEVLLCWTCLSAVQVHVHVINPLALSNNELYGSFDEGTHEWQDGVLARIMRTVCKDDSPDQKWILFDGPVDTLWIESMNTLLDDNKLLTLLSGERSEDEKRSLVHDENLRIRPSRSKPDDHNRRTGLCSPP